MSHPEVTAAEDIDFLLATPTQATATEAVRTQPASADPAAHDAYTRLEPDSEALWAEVQPDVRRMAGVLVRDDTVLDKPYARKMDLVYRLWSGKHHRVVRGTGLLSLLWTDGDRHLPCDYRPTDQKTKNDHFGDLIRAAQARGLAPECVLFDGWYKQPGQPEAPPVGGVAQADPAEGQPAGEPGPDGPAGGGHLRHRRGGHGGASGGVRAHPGVRIAATGSTTEHWATSNLRVCELGRVQLADASWRIEEYHRGLKQVTNVQRCPCRRAVAQRGHIGLALRAFVVVERWSPPAGVVQGGTGGRVGLSTRPGVLGGRRASGGSGPGRPPHTQPHQPTQGQSVRSSARSVGGIDTSSPSRIKLGGRGS